MPEGSDKLSREQSLKMSIAKSMGALAQTAQRLEDLDAFLTAEFGARWYEGMDKWMRANKPNSPWLPENQVEHP